MPNIDAHQGDELLSVREIAETMGWGESTVWLFISKHDLPRYRLPSRGKTTLIKWADFVAAYTTPKLADTEGKAAA